MPEKELRFGIVGPGAVAHNHSLAVQQAVGARLVAICGRDKTATNSFAEKYGISAFTDQDAFFNSSDLDAIIIATPSGTHLELGALAAGNGKHVLCEKPLEVTPEKSADLISICKENNVYLGVFFQARFDECTRIAKDAIDSGRLGNILFASCQMRWSRSQEYYDSAAWRGTWQLDGGGSLMNQGIHSVDLLIHLVGDPVEVSGLQGLSTHERIEVEDNLCAAVRFENGAIGTIEASTSCAPGFPRRIDISGDKGSISIEGERIVRWDFIEPEAIDAEVIAKFTGEQETIGGATDPMAIDVSGHRHVIEDFVESVHQNRQPFIDGEEGKRAVDFVCAIYESIKTGKQVNLE